MALMRYKAIDDRGKFTSGRMEVVNAADLEMRLSRMGLDLVSCRETRTQQTLFGARRVARRDLISFCFHLEQLVSARARDVVIAVPDLIGEVGEDRLAAVRREERLQPAHNSQQLRRALVLAQAPSDHGARRPKKKSREQHLRR